MISMRSLSFLRDKEQILHLILAKRPRKVWLRKYIKNDHPKIFNHALQPTYGQNSHTLLSFLMWIVTAIVANELRDTVHDNAVYYISRRLDALWRRTLHYRLLTTTLNYRKANFLNWFWSAYQTLWEQSGELLIISLWCAGRLHQ